MKACTEITKLQKNIKWKLSLLPSRAPQILLLRVSNNCFLNVYLRLDNAFVFKYIYKLKHIFSTIDTCSIPYLFSINNIFWKLIPHKNTCIYIFPFKSLVYYCMAITSLNHFTTDGHQSVSRLNYYKQCCRTTFLNTYLCTHMQGYSG